MAVNLRPLRVLHVSHSTGLWGAEQALLRLAPLLVERAVDVRLAAPPEGPLPAAWEALGLPFVPLVLPPHAAPLRRPDGTGRRPGPADLARNGAVVASSVRAVARLAGPVDILHSQSLNAHLETAVAGRLARTPVVLQQHDLVRPGAGQRVLTAATRVASAMSAITDVCAACVGPSARGKAHVIRYGLDLDRFRPGDADPEVRASLGGADGSPLVGILGRIDPRKQVDVLVRAMAQLGPDADARLVVVGGPQLSSQAFVDGLQADATAALGDRVRFVGPRSDVVEVLRSLDVLVNASAAEPFGLTLLEAQACGTPVIATDSGGAPEFVRHERTGLLVPPGDADGLSAALARLLADGSLRSSLARAARQQVEEQYDQRRQADEVRALYDLVARRPAA